MGGDIGGRWMVRGAWLAGMLLVAVVLGLTAAGRASADPTLPSQDPFYSYPGSLSGIAPGTVLNSRTVSLAEIGLSTPLSATQVLYRTTGQLGQPTVTVATVISPLASLGPTKIVSYQTAYDALGSECDPSYTLQGGNSSYSTAQDEEQLILTYVAAGDTVVVPDYEGETLDWGAGQESGYDTLDGIRAAEGLLGVSPSSTPVAMVGYSGGSIATEYASEEAPTYAAELHIVGAAAGGVPVDFAHNLTYVNGSPDWSGVIPAVLVGLGRAFNVDFSPYLSSYGQQVTSQVQGGCINNFTGSYPGLTLQQLLLPQYQDYTTVPVIVTTLNDEIMSDTGTPRFPMFLAVGNSDGTGDGVMVAKDVQALAYTYCQRGLPIKFTEYDGDNHTAAAVPFESTALSYLSGLLAGSSPENDCASIGPGNSLAPLPVPGSSSSSSSSSSGSAAMGQSRLKFRDLGRNRRKHGVVIELWTSAGTLRGLVIKVRHGKHVVDTLKGVRVTTSKHKLVLRVHRQMPPPGRYTITITSGKTVLLRRTIRVL